ncbi:ABC-2 type transport system ATP-binding protein [Lachnospiraceae bacterium PF1-21]|uniref:ABC transporter ATP-binding protein n=1 Tax=Ohessyouella blattaphilus TaxID=2949333 RepID=UPI00256AD3EC|nr:ABC transporter ATP-binding protein [Lachnospiraceae bacterium OttesenSCG-928-J05]
MNSINVQGLSKSFGTVEALKNVTLTIEENKIYGLLGRNGAGKTTLLNSINNRIFPTSGEILFGEKSVIENEDVQRNFFFVGEQLLFPENMNAKKAIRWAKEFYPHFDEDYAKELMSLFEVPIKKKVKSLSTGYKTIFKNIIALSVNVPFVFLDEPVLGLDANHRELFYKALLEKYSNSPSTYVISTHLIEEVANIVEDVIIIKKGEILRAQSRDSLLETGYSVTGMANLVDQFCQDKEVIGLDALGGIKSAYIIGEKPREAVDGLDISTMDLQKLFVKMTNA